MQTELKVAREVGLCRDCTEVCTSERGVWARKQWCIESVEGLRAELYVQSVANQNALEQRDVPVFIAGTTQRQSARSVAKRVGRRGCECCRVDIAVQPIK